MRVRKYGFVESMSTRFFLYILGEDVYRALAFASVGRTPLLPRLTDLCSERFTVNKESPHIGLFLSPSIQNLKFMIGGETEYTRNARFSLLPPLVSACPNLTHLSLSGMESLPWEDILFAISAISKWSSLRRLTVRFPDPQLIKHENSVENPSMPVMGFTKLEHLDTISTIEFSIKLFHCMSHAHLQTLRVDSSNDLETHQWSELFKAVQHGILQFSTTYSHQLQS
jgi:hypothetical protein